MRLCFKCCNKFESKFIFFFLTVIKYVGDLVQQPQKPNRKQALSTFRCTHFLLPTPLSFPLSGSEELVRIPLGLVKNSLRLKAAKNISIDIISARCQRQVWTENLFQIAIKYFNTSWRHPEHNCAIIPCHYGTPFSQLPLCALRLH